VTSRERLLGTAGLAVLVCALFWPAVFEGRVFFERDILVFFVPQTEALVRAAAEGAWPIWDPRPAFGQPLTNPEPQLFYPFTALNLVVSPWVYYTIFVLFHSVFSGLGVLILGRRWGMTITGAFVAASLWVLSGPFLSLVNVWQHFAGAAWIPWVLLGTERALDDPSLGRSVQWGALFGGQILAGSADMCAMTGLCSASLVLGRLFFSPDARPRRAGAALVAFFFAAGLGAALWLPSLALLREGGRRHFSETLRTYWSVHPLTLLETALPQVFDRIPFSPALEGMLFEGREPFLRSLYLGLPTLALVAAAWSAPKKRTFWLSLVALGSTLVSLGRHFPLYALLCFLVPPLRILRYPVKATALLAFSASCLAGLGLDAFRLGPPRWARVLGPLILLNVLGAFVLFARPVALAPWLNPQVPEGPRRELLSQAGWMFLGEASVGLLLLASARLPLKRGLLLVTALALGDLFFHNRVLNPLAPEALYRQRPEIVKTLARADRIYVYDYHQSEKARLHLGHALSLRAHPEGWGPVETGALAKEMYLLPAIGERFGLASGFDVDYRGLQPVPQAGLTSLLLESEGSRLHTRLLELGGITHVVALHEMEELVPVATLPGLFVDPIRVFRVQNPLPRTYAVDRTRVADGLLGVPILADPGFDARHEIILPARAPHPPPPTASFSGGCRIKAERPDRILLEASLSDPGFVVLLDSFDPGWKARVDGQPADVYPANLAFRAVFVPGGNHTIELLYRPRALVIGLAISGISCLLGLLVLARKGG
jgi:hypothetical protein